MKGLYVSAEFDWAKESRLIGEPRYESHRGSDLWILDVVFFIYI